MSLNRVLNIGNSGLIAASLGTATASHNITNANTPGYSRQQVAQAPRPIHHGGGLSLESPTRVRDGFVERRLLTATSLDGEATARSDSLQTLDALFEDVEGGIGDALGSFESAVADLTNDPDSPAARQLLLTRATQLSQAFNRASSDLKTAQDDANGRIKLTLGAINQKLQTIGDLGQEIVAAGTIGEDSSTLLDQRDQLIREVAEHLPVTVIDQPDGAVTVLLAGSRSLVPLDGPVPKLIAGTDADGNTTVLRQGTGAPEDVTSLITSGSIAGYISARDGAIAQAQTDLDELAHDITSAYNTAHQAGVGLDGVGPRDLFEPLASADDAAELMALSSDVAGQPDNIAAGFTTATGDNRNALAMLDLATTDIANGGTASASEAFGVALSRVGVAVQDASTRAGNASSVRAQAQALRDSISGVSTDEEMVALMKYQRAYQASLRVVETADSMLAELLSMRR